MSYYIDLSKISMDTYQEMLLNRYLIPSQMVLRENIDAHFKKLQDSGIRNMQDLLLKLKTKKSAEMLAAALDIPIDYMVVLRREVGGHHPQARKTDEYPTIDDAVKAGLNEMGVTSSDQLYPLVLTPDDRKALGTKLGVLEVQMLHIAKLMDVTRLRYVSPLFATLLVHSPYDTVVNISKADPKTMYDDLAILNAAQQFFKGKLGKNDTLFLIQDTQHVDIDLVLS